MKYYVDILNINIYISKKYNEKLQYYLKRKNSQPGRILSLFEFPLFSLLNLFLLTLLNPVLIRQSNNLTKGGEYAKKSIMCRGE